MEFTIDKRIMLIIKYEKGETPEKTSITLKCLNRREITSSWEYRKRIIEHGETIGKYLNLT